MHHVRESGGGHKAADADKGHERKNTDHAIIFIKLADAICDGSSNLFIRDASPHWLANDPSSANGTNRPCRLPLKLVRKLGSSCQWLRAGHRPSAMEGRPSVGDPPIERRR